MKTALTAAAFTLAFSTSAFAEDKVVNFATDDPVMNAAIAKARAGLPQFWDKFASHDATETGFALKVGISNGTNTEHFWCGNIEGTRESSTCVIDNEPEVVTTVKLGQRIEVKQEQISDWMYHLNGKIKGGETIRVIIPRLSAEEGAYYKSLLADP